MTSQEHELEPLRGVLDEYLIFFLKKKKKKLKKPI
jgi:hypothetical protein